MHRYTRRVPLYYKCTVIVPFSCSPNILFFLKSPNIPFILKSPNPLSFQNVFSERDQYCAEARVSVIDSRGTRTFPRGLRLVCGQEQPEVRPVVVHLPVCCSSGQLHNSGLRVKTTV